MMKYDSLFLQWIIFRQKPKIGGANMKNKEADTELESRLLEILEIGRASCRERV